MSAHGKCDHTIAEHRPHSGTCPEKQCGFYGKKDSQDEDETSLTYSESIRGKNGYHTESSRHYPSEHAKEKYLHTHITVYAHRQKRETSSFSDMCQTVTPNIFDDIREGKKDIFRIKIWLFCSQCESHTFSEYGRMYDNEHTQSRYSDAPHERISFIPIFPKNDDQKRNSHEK